MAALKILVMAVALACSAPVQAGAVDRWSGHIAEASARFNIPAVWIRRVMQVESGGRLTQNGRPIVSSAGAMGLMQLMPGTWRDMRLALRLGDDPHDPRDNILGGSLYLRLMYDRFGYPGLFAAYNAGPARYAAALRGGPLPRETRAYVSKLARAETVGGIAPRPVSPPTLFAVAPAPARPAALASRPPRPGTLFVALGGRERDPANPGKGRAGGIGGE